MSLLRFLSIRKFYGGYSKLKVCTHFSTKGSEEPKKEGKVIKVAALQLNVTSEKCQNLVNAESYIRMAASDCPHLIVLPECFNSPYEVENFKENAETIPDGETSEMLSKAAKHHAVFIVGGTFPEEGGDCKIYNTCTVWNPEGNLIAKYRKMHLFDIDIPGKISFKESETLTGGCEQAYFCIDGVKIGLGICYDMRFEELAKLYRMDGCDILIYPGAFNMTTGPLHWELLQRGRANDNQLFFITVSPARGKEGYIAWGHSTICSPWGKVLAKAAEGEEIIVANLDLSECDSVREQIPIFCHRRTDIYNTVKVNK